MVNSRSCCCCFAFIACSTVCGTEAAVLQPTTPHAAALLLPPPPLPPPPLPPPPPPPQPSICGGRCPHNPTPSLRLQQLMFTSYLCVTRPAPSVPSFITTHLMHGPISPGTGSGHGRSLPVSNHIVPLHFTFTVPAAAMKALSLLQTPSKLSRRSRFLAA